MRFSAIVPVYNKGPYIRKALTSILSQTFRDFELIIVDDGSSDNSYATAQECLTDVDVPFQLIRQKNSGVSTARNNGVAASRGDYLCFLDADDWWAPNYLERMTWLITEYPDAGVYGTNYYYVKNNHQRISVTTAETGYIDYCKVYSKKLQMPLWTGATCVPRKVIDKMGGFKTQLTLGEDFDLWIRIALKHNVAFLNEPLSYYNQDADSKWRLVGKLHDPQKHMLWNLDYLQNEEETNPDYKTLIDNLRVYSLLPYYLSKQYRESARQELSKVDWDKQPYSIKTQYNKPVYLLKGSYYFMKLGAIVKQWVIKHL